MKKFIVLLMLLLPMSMSMVGQEIKIATVNTNEVMSAMPEIDVLENELIALQKQYQNMYKALSEEYERKMTDYLAQQDSLAENIKTMRLQDMEGIRTRVDNLQQAAIQDEQEKKEKHLTPVYEKVKNAINQVGKENGYTCIIAPEALLFQGESIIDATDKVKAKLGLK